MHPIISTIGTFDHNVSRWFVPKLAPLTMNSFTVKDPFTLAEEIIQIKDISKLI